MASGASSLRPSAARRSSKRSSETSSDTSSRSTTSEWLADLLEHGVERLGLGHRAREAVEHEAVLLGEPRPDEVDHELVGHEVPALEDRLDSS